MSIDPYLERSPLTPAVNGTYACKCWHGWKILRWWDSQWWIDRGAIRWAPKDVEMFVGPLPGDEPAYAPAPKSVLEFDL